MIRNHSRVDAGWAKAQPTFLGLAVLVCLAGLLPSVGQGQVVWPETAPVDNVLVMRSGEVFQGRVTKNGDRFVVHVPVGEVSLRASDVDFTSATLVEAYARKRERIQPDSARTTPSLPSGASAKGCWTWHGGRSARPRRWTPRSP